MSSDVTKQVWVGTRGDVFHLAGPDAGVEGVVAGADPSGTVFAPVKLLMSEGARQDGATFLRDVKDKREFDFSVLISGSSFREVQSIHDKWFRNWSSRKPGHMCYYTPYLGWRTTELYLGEAPTPTLGVDMAYNDAEVYDMLGVGMDPLYHLLDEEQVFDNALGTNEGVNVLRNAGDQVGWPRHTMNGPGRWYIEDPTLDDSFLRAVQTPMLLMGETLQIDTHPRRPTARLYSAGGGENSRNVWGQLQGRRWLTPVEPWTAKELFVQIEGGNTNSKLISVVTPRASRPY